MSDTTLEDLISLVKEFENDITIDRLVSILSEHLSKKKEFSIIVIQLFNQYFENIKNVSIGTKLENKKNISKIEDFFPEKKIYYYPKWSQHQDLRKIHPELEEAKSVMIYPLTFNKKIIGLIEFGLEEKTNSLEKDREYFNFICLLFNIVLEQIMFRDFYLKQNNKLKQITKDMRHDLSNDLQSIALAFELLQTTEITKDQQKYFQILGRGKEEAINKIQKLKDMKDKTEESIDNIL
ncbi:MAG: hypothetical protein U9O98_06260 [Asgard group archaeon]|nr:hypothetical protein [Asgard group archaeon]